MFFIGLGGMVIKKRTINCELEFDDREFSQG
jgi:hypothetical protein